MQTSNRHGSKKAASTLGVSVIALLLVIAVVYGLYTIRTSDASGGSLNFLNLAATSTNTVSVYGNATVPPSNGECGGSYPASVTFYSTQSGASYVANVPNAQNSISGHYSLNLSNNNQYNVTIQVKNRCLPLSQSIKLFCWRLEPLVERC